MKESKERRKRLLKEEKDREKEFSKYSNGQRINKTDDNDNFDNNYYDVPII